jgi:hypothetical protein
MSYRKTKLIQERNILLESRFLFEQEKVVTGSTTTQPTGTTTPNVTTTTTTIKITDSEIRSLPDCSSFNSKEFPIQSGVTKNNVTVFTYNGKNFCKKEK